MVIAIFVFQHGNQNVCLMRVLNLLLHLTVFLQHLKFGRSCLKQNKLTFTYKNKVNIYIVSEINLWPFKQSTDKKFCFSLHCNGVNSYLFVNDVEIYKFKTKDSEINAGSLCLDNISKEFLADYMKKNGLYG